MSKRVVVWACVADTDPEPMTGQIDVAETGGGDPHASAFAAALPTILAQIEPWLARLASGTSLRLAELAVLNPTLRQRLREGPPLDGVLVLPASEVTEANATVGAARQLVEQLHRDVIAPGREATVEVAVGASVRAHHRDAGVAWARADGLYETRVVDASDQTAALVRAIVLAVRAHRRHEGRLEVVCSSRAAVSLARDALTGRPLSSHRARAAAQRALADLDTAGTVRIVRAGGGGISRAAARLATVARHNHEAGVAGPEHERRAAAALADELGRPAP
ncbi:hypothetical protein HF998_02930 [Cellulomonas hominis]|nr:hypothetical protein [Cellulomonas hominis]